MAVRTVRRGLSTAELEHIRDTLAGGRRPKVVFTEAAGQIAGQQGQVVQLTDPQLSDEWVVVRFGRDELPFSPADLAMPPKGASARKAVKAVQSPPFVPPTADAPAGPPASAGPAAASTAPALPAPREETTVPAPSTEQPNDAKPQAASGGAAPAKTPARRTGKAKVPAGLSVTLSYADGDWTVAAQQGSKVLAKPYVIKAADALKMVALLDVPNVQEAVEEIVSAARVEAEAQAQRLRGELAEIEARLAELSETG